jgi:hypothetical protein
MAESTNLKCLKCFAEQWWKFVARNGCDYRRLSASGWRRSTGPSDFRTVLDAMIVPPGFGIAVPRLGRGNAVVKTKSVPVRIEVICDDFLRIWWCIFGS